MRTLLLSLALATLALAAPGASAQSSRTPWQFNPGGDDIDATSLNPILGGLGDPRYFQVATIPAFDDAAWEGAPGGGGIISYTGYQPHWIAGCGGNPPCFGGGTIRDAAGSYILSPVSEADFSYFQSFFLIPIGTPPGDQDFRVVFGGVDDGAKIVIFNSDNPGGASLSPAAELPSSGAASCPAGFSSCTDNLWSLVKEGEYNRIVITQWDTSPVGNNLSNAQLTVGGTTLVEAVFTEDFGDAPTTAQTLLVDDGARHTIGALRLGAEVDGFIDATPNATASGDDNFQSPDDEDGVQTPAFIIFSDAGTSLMSFSVSVTGGTGGVCGLDACASIWIDLDRSGTFDGGELLTGAPIPVSNGPNVITLPLAGSGTHAAGASYVRVRLSSAGETSPKGLAADGEVEDYVVSLVDGDLAGSTDQVIDLTLHAVDEVRVVGSNLCLASGGVDLNCGPASGFSSLTLNGTASPETLTIDFSGGDPGIPISVNGGGGDDDLIIDLAGLIPTSTVTFDGGADADSATITGAGGPYDLFSDHFTEPSGEVFIDGVLLLDYDNIEPLIVTLTLADAEFQFNALANVVELNDDGDPGGAGNGISFIDCAVCGESVSFTTPTDNLIVHLGDGDDTINFTSLDTPVVPATIIIEGEAGNDLFNITPSAAYGMLVDGGAPITCDGDQLDLDLTGVTGAAQTVVAPGTGNWAFDAPTLTVNFTGMEVRLDAQTDVQVAVAWNDSTGYPADEREVTFTLTNLGGDEATCIDSEITLPSILKLLPGFPTEVYPLFGSGSYAPTTWEVARLLSGDSATLTFRGVLDWLMPQTFSTTIDATAPTAVLSDDPDLTNNIATQSLEVLPIFRFPAKGTAISAAYMELPSGLERLVGGLFQGSPGFTTAVLCRIPDPDFVFFTQPGVGDHWRPCGENLPYPLHATDLMVDDRDTPGDVTDDRLWLASWGSAGLYYSDDYGETFSAAEPELGAGNNAGWKNVYTITKDAGSVLYISANNGLVFRSFNDGGTWQQVASLPGASADTPWSLEAHPTVAGTIYAGTFGRGLYVTADFGFTWAPLGGTAVNDGLLDTDNSGDDFAGHVFDMAFSPDGAGFLFAGTGKGVWRIPLDVAGVPTGIWSQLAVNVTLDNGQVVVPEIRVLSFMIASADADEDLLIGSWGLGAFINKDPLAGAAFSPLALREGQVSMILPKPDGTVLVGTNEFGIGPLEPVAATATDTAPDADSTIPRGYALEQNYPNPFNPVTTIQFALPETGRIRLAVYDVLGREVALLAAGTLSAGQHQVQFDALNLPSGTYVYRLDTNQGAFAKQLILMK
jgi:GEVED domain-containing protein/type IX secretion system substrate protein/uncharacterized protein DUF11